VLRRKFGPKTEVMSGGRKRLHNEELHKLYASTTTTTTTTSDEMGGTCSIHGSHEKYNTLVGKLEQKRPLDFIATFVF